MSKLRLLIAFVAFIVATSPVLAVNPDEILPDAGLESRARDISANLRCLVCQNQSIDDSDAELARDLRVLVRERLVAGDTDAQIVDYVVDRYGEFVLLRPSFSSRNLVLWGTPILVLFVGGLTAFLYSRRQAQRNGVLALSSDEEQRLSKLLDNEDDSVS